MHEVPPQLKPRADVEGQPAAGEAGRAVQGGVGRWVWLDDEPLGVAR